MQQTISHYISIECIFFIFGCNCMDIVQNITGMPVGNILTLYEVEYCTLRNMKGLACWIFCSVLPNMYILVYYYTILYIY